MLAGQGFSGQRLDELLCMLSYPHPVADTASVAGRLALGLWDIQRLDRNRLAELAITSESPDLPFADRVRVIVDNLTLVPEAPPKRAAVIGAQVCEALAGPAQLANLVLVDSSKVGLGNDAVRAILPEAADLPRLAAQYANGRASAIADVLHALGVPSINAAALRSRASAEFAAIWARLATGGRLDLLAWLGRDDAALPPHATDLDTVLVGEGDGMWASPTAVIAPAWTIPAPPNVPCTTIVRTAGVPQGVLRLWDRWCGFRDLAAVVGLVVRKTSDLPREQWPSAAQHLAVGLRNSPPMRAPQT